VLAGHFKIVFQGAEAMTSDLAGVGTVIQLILFLAALATALAMVFGVRTMTAALALLALSFIGLAIRGEPSAIAAVAMGALMELRLMPRRRHRGLLEWLLVSLGLCQIALALTQEEYRFTFWVAQGMGFTVLVFAIIAAFAPHWWQPPALGGPSPLTHPSDRGL